jgi:hypothetical protein
MLSSTKFDLIRNFAARVYLVELRNPYPCTVYSILIHTGKEGRGESFLNQREGERAQRGYSS